MPLRRLLVGICYKGTFKKQGQALVRPIACVQELVERLVDLVGLVVLVGFVGLVGWDGMGWIG